MEFSSGLPWLGLEGEPPRLTRERSRDSLISLVEIEQIELLIEVLPVHSLQRSDFAEFRRATRAGSVLPVRLMSPFPRSEDAEVQGDANLRSNR